MRKRQKDFSDIRYRRMMRIIKVLYFEPLSIKDLMRITGMSERPLTLYLRELTKGCWIERHLEKMNRGRPGYCYSVLIPDKVVGEECNNL